MLSYSDITDNELAALLKKGDQAAYTEIYNRYHAALYIQAFNRLRNREESRDLVHDLFSNLWQKKDNFELTGSLSAYLYTSIRYKVLDLFAHKNVETGYIRSVGSQPEPLENNTDHLARERQMRDLIEREIAALPPKMREIFELSRKGLLSHREIAGILNLSEKTVKKQVNNSLKLLRGRLGKNLFFALFL